MDVEQLDYQEREIVVRAALDDLDEDGSTWVSLRFMRGPRAPRENEPVYLLDPSGHGRLGRVVELHGWVARVKLDEDRVDGEDVRLTAASTAD